VETVPYSRRGVKLTVLDEETQDTLAQLKDDIDVSMVTSLWEKLKDITCWSKPSIWIHGDLLPGNILIKNNQLSVVIDFSDLGLGDPACDLVPA